MFSKTPIPPRNRRKVFAILILACLTGVVPAYSGAEADLPEFSGDRALELLVAQCELGPRYPGSKGHRQLQEMIAEMAHDQGFPAFSLFFDTTDPESAQPVQGCNIVVSAGPQGGVRLWLGAHYDTRPHCDQDPDPDMRLLPLPGANDGASGVAVLLHLLEILSANPAPQGVDFLFFDLEDSGLAGDPRGFCLGSQHLAKTWEEFGNPLAQGRPRGLIVLDMVGKKNLQIPLEAYSLANAPDWTGTVFDRAVQLGLDAFLHSPGPAVYDDHVPFLVEGIPAVDLIDFGYPQWHTAADTPDRCSAESLAQVGRLMVDLIYRP